MNFNESLAYLLTLGNEVSAMKLGLESIGKLLAALGSPEKKYLKVQVAGTNGKGSTCAFLDSICISARIKTGLYTSPHLISVTERIKINGEQIGETDFARHASKVREVSENLASENQLETVPTFFEQITAIALHAFAEVGIELAILETGLGGRYDAVTAANAEIAAITPIDFDHQNILGATLTLIAAEKAAIIRENMKVVVAAEQHAEAMSVIVQKCASINVEPRFSNYRTDLRVVDAGSGRLSATFYGEEIYRDVKLSLSGRHQLANARVSIGLAEILRKDFGFKIDKFHIKEGLEKARHDGRLEFYKGVLFDGAHNVAGAKALKEFLDEFIGQPVTMIFGAMRDKDLKEIAEILFPKAAILIFTKPDNSRSLESSELIKFLPENFSEKNVFQTETVAEALKLAEENFVNKNLVCVTGSLYLVGEARKLLNNKSVKFNFED